MCSLFIGLAAVLDHTFRDESLLELAMTHRSRGLSRGHNAGTNERLEFLGDRVLGLVVADMLYHRFPAENEGALARRHAALVRREALADVASRLNLGDFLILAKGDEDLGGRTNPALLADACEAVIGAIYLDGGFDAASGFIRRFWIPLMDKVTEPPKDPKTGLQEWAQKRGLPLPVYETVAADGPDHNPSFTIRVMVQGVPPEVASGPSKRIAAQMAARILLEKLG
ncbi:ribonuclease III [Haematospirillum jordaniae]|uniref:Ribonuclease 3 n=1 Tax=Haematospirillum jordaniae TaxID=1549855 RepID=A0A143DEI7_9PROT|nr:ribonuclease III [Haematospirillum jordaniae]AMW35127.1 ribonuclease [Haematospirillum jordaniae]